MALFLPDPHCVHQPVPPAPAELREAPGWSLCPGFTSSSAAACSLCPLSAARPSSCSFPAPLMGLRKSRRWQWPCPRLNSRSWRLCLLGARIPTASAGGCSARGDAEGSPAQRHHFSLSPSRPRLHKQQSSLGQSLADGAVEHECLLELPMAQNTERCSVRLVLARRGGCSLRSVLPFGSQLANAPRKGPILV